ncbi:MAG: YezD family protein [Veillonellaceae bacterium]|jgi:hypothetical protein|nr:YezD family protein [Veillonellaceae bacterium]
MKKDLANLEIPEEVLDIIEKAIDGIDFGSVTLIVQDSRVIQIERVEKIRLC